MPRLRAFAAAAASVPITLFGLVLVTFLIGRVMPIDPTIAIVGDHAPPDVIAAVRAQLGLDRPLFVQFCIYLGQLAHGSGVDAGLAAIFSFGTHFFLPFAERICATASTART